MCSNVGEDGASHFPGHNQRGGRLARSILQRLRAPAWLAEGVASLVSIHDNPLPETDAEALLMLYQRGPVFVQRLARLKLADLAAHAPIEAVAHRMTEVRDAAAHIQELARTGCYTVAGLAVNGGDLLAAGLAPGPAVGATLDRLLHAVMQGALPNERQALLRAAREGMRS